MFLPAGQLVFQPVARLFELLGFDSMRTVGPACSGYRGGRPLVVVRGSQSAGTSGE